MDIFISYAREDAETANRLYHALQEIPRVTPWLDSKKLLPGIQWKHATMEALKSCDLFILLLSSKSVSKSGFVQKEISEALEKLKSIPPDEIFLIPARVDQCEPKHPELHDLQWVDFFPIWDDGLRRILDVVERHLGEKISVPSPADDIVVEVINSQKSFETRLHDRGELRAIDAMELDFSSMDLSARDFSGANFVRCNFVDCDLRHSLLRGTNFEGANFKNCRLAKADLWGVNFWGADIRGILDFDQAIIEQTNFFRTQLTLEQQVVVQSADSLSLGDYGTFLEYFTSDGGMTREEYSKVFTWFNHRYFRQMFGENTRITNLWDALHRFRD